jgi:hypothetical protein
LFVHIIAQYAKLRLNYNKYMFMSALSRESQSRTNGKLLSILFSVSSFVRGHFRQLRPSALGQREPDRRHLGHRVRPIPGHVDGHKQSGRDDGGQTARPLHRWHNVFGQQREIFVFARKSASNVRNAVFPPYFQNPLYFRPTFSASPFRTFLLGRWLLALDLFGRVFVNDVELEPGSIVSEQGGFQV